MSILTLLFLQIIFDPRDEVLNTTYKFIDEALHLGDAVLVKIYLLIIKFKMEIYFTYIIILI